MDENRIITVLREMNGLLVNLTSLVGRLAADRPELAQDVRSIQKLADSVRVMLELQRTNQ
jgi:hypothetical protein